MSDIKGKLIIVGTIELLSGLHIGSGGQSGIGLIDSPVIKHPLKYEPYIPGSSLKGRLRAALDYMTTIDSENVKHLFGGSDEKDKRAVSRVYVRDSHLADGQKNVTEIKYENTIDRVTGKTRNGGLRQVERVVSGTKFDFELVYNYDDASVLKEYEDAIIIEDLKKLESCFSFVEDEYLGGSGSRGYGKVKFHFKNLTYKSQNHYLGKEEAKSKDISDSPKWSECATELIS